LAKGIIEEELPMLVCEPSNIDLPIKVDEAVRFEIEVRSDNKIPLKGVAYSDNIRVKVVDATFGGIKNVLVLEINSKNLNSDEKIEGSITLVTNAGEREIPYIFYIKNTDTVLVLDSLKTVDDFMVIAKEDMSIALAIFMYKDFCSSSFMRDIKLQKLYETLSRGDDFRSNLENFLQAAGNKEAVSFQLENSQLDFASVEEEKTSSIKVYKENWGLLDIDVSEALALEGVVAIYTSEDVPNNKVGHIQQDWDVMIPKGEVTRFVGDALCLVVAESEEILKKAKTLVKVEYEVLEPVRNIDEAKAENAPKVHPNGNLCQSRHVKRGDAKEAIANSKYTVTETFDTPFTEHAFLEPECAIAMPYKDGVKIFSTDQSVFDTRKEVAIMFGWDPSKVVVENKYVGGGFGGKEDVSVQHIAALCAYKLGRTVKAKFSRDESLAFHPKRHAMHGTFTLGCDENGIFTGLDCDIYFDTGAYASLCGPVLERACTHAVGPYCYQNHDIRGYGYYTNNPPAGAFRGFGVCQSEFALESIIDLLAEKVGISPWEIRYRNAIEPGKVLPNGQIADCSTALKETLEAVKDAYEANYPNVGLACAMKNAGVGVGLPDTGRAKLIVNDGIIEIYCGASDIGQGCATIFIQMAAETLNLPKSKFKNMGCNSEFDPDSGTTSGSRQTLISGEAIRRVSLELKKDLDAVGGDLNKLNGKDYYAEYFEPTDKLGADVPFPKSHVAYGFATHLVVLDDDGKVKKVYAAHDSGKVVNPISIQGQIEGGVLMSLGYALTEDFKLQDCMVKSKYGTLGLMRATDIPEIEAIYVEKEELLGVAYGSKGIGEIATIPTAPAVQNAYYKRDGKLRPKLPMDDTYCTNKKTPT